MLKATFVVLLGTLALPAAWSQSIISARSGLVHYTEGRVALAGEPLDPTFAEFPQMKIGETLTTKEGARAEVLLGPGSTLRLGADSSAQLLDDRLSNTRVKILAGTALVEVIDIDKDAKLAIQLGDSEISLLKNGIYSFDAATGQVRVYDGKAQAAAGDQLIPVTRGRSLAVNAAAEPEKFKTKEKDALYQWSKYRSQVLTMANISSASSAGVRPRSGNAWVYNTFLNIYTFLPGRGTLQSPFGWVLYSPSTVWIVIQPRYYDSGWGGGGAPASQGWSGMSNTASSPAAASAVPSAGVATRSDSAPAAPAAAAAPSSGRGR
jgi:hypothetical protein